jgi:hypothetical protein
VLWHILCLPVIQVILCHAVTHFVPSCGTCYGTFSRGKRGPFPKVFWRRAHFLPCCGTILFVTCKLQLLKSARTKKRLRILDTSEHVESENIKFNRGQRSSAHQLFIHYKMWLKLAKIDQKLNFSIF